MGQLAQQISSESDKQFPSDCSRKLDLKNWQFLFTLSIIDDYSDDYLDYCDDYRDDYHNDYHDFLNWRFYRTGEVYTAALTVIYGSKAAVRGRVTLNRVKRPVNLYSCTLQFI